MPNLLTATFEVDIDSPVVYELGRRVLPNEQPSSSITLTDAEILEYHSALSAFWAWQERLAKAGP